MGAPGEKPTDMAEAAPGGRGWSRSGGLAPAGRPQAGRPRDWVACCRCALLCALLALGNMGQVKRRVHARTHARPSPPPPPPQHNISPTAFSSDNFFYLCSLHIGIRQGALPKFHGDLEAVASPWSIHGARHNWAGKSRYSPDFVLY
jgi:hypothetical protein